MSTENNDRTNLPGGETLNDRLRRAAAMARRDKQSPSPSTERPVTSERPRTEAPRRKEEAPRQQVPTTSAENPYAAYMPKENRPASEPHRQERREEVEQETSSYSAPQPQRHAHRMPEEEYTIVTPEEKPKKKLFTKVGILVALLVVAVLAIIALTVTSTKRAVEQQQQIEQLQLANEQLQLSNEYDALNNEFAQYENQTSLLANDSIVQKYSAARAQVEKLLQELKNEKNKSAAQISKLKDEIATLKSILRNYVEQINALNQENQELRDENKQVKARNQQLSNSIKTVEANNKVLNERMTLAEKLNVTGVTLTPLNKKGKKEKKVTKARQLMVTFTIPQNNSTPVGEKIIWLRITNPEGDLLPGGGSFEFEDSTLPATARKSIEYAGEEIGGVTIYWDVNTTLTPGDYTVELFCDNFRLTSRKFTLTK